MSNPFHPPAPDEPSTPPAAGTAAPAPATAPAPAAPSVEAKPVDPAQAAAAAAIAAGYASDGPALDLGAVVLDGTAFPGEHVRVPLAMVNRHGLIAGATGTGKTRTLQLLTERLSAHGVPVVVADLKGDLSGLAKPGTANDRVTTRVADTGDDWTPTAFPVEFLALGGLGNGVPVRATVTSFGPILLSKVLGLNATQESSLNLVFHWADKAKLPLVDLKDLQSVVRYLVSDDGRADLETLGGISKATAGVIGRQLVTLADGGGDVFFGEPEWSPADLLRTAADGRGVVSSIELAAVQDKPVLFSTFLMWLLADLFEELPEVGDLDAPKLVFFFDEAHLLFDDASKAFLDAVAQTVRLIRSKGVGIFFVTQHPTDVPDEVLGQLGNRVQHALRAFTPDDATALRKTVRTYPTTKDYDLAGLLTQLGTGEAVVTVLSERGAPTPVAWTRLAPPRADMGQLPAEQQSAAVQASPLFARYGAAVDRESAYELLAARLAPPPAAPPPAAPPPAAPPAAPPAPPSRPAEPERQPTGKRKAEPEEDGGALGTIGKVLGSKAFQSMARSMGTQLGREITRGVFGTRRR